MGGTDCFLSFDEAKHGFAALATATGDGASRSREDNSNYPDDFPEPAPPYEVVVRFEFASDTLGSDECKGREADAFTWITILARRPNGSMKTLLDWECA